MVPWDQPGVDWAAFDATVIRATWNYTLRLRGVPRLGRPRCPGCTTRRRWCCPTPTRPTWPRWPRRPAGGPTGGAARRRAGAAGAGEFVLKPSVGAGSRGVGRFDAGRPGAHQQAREHARRLHAIGRTVLVQPYLDAVDTAGETALIFFDGVFSHAIRKGPMLQPDTRHPVDGEALYIEENITRARALRRRAGGRRAGLRPCQRRPGGEPALRPDRPAARPGRPGADRAGAGRAVAVPGLRRRRRRPAGRRDQRPGADGRTADAADRRPSRPTRRCECRCCRWPVTPSGARGCAG